MWHAFTFDHFHKFYNTSTSQIEYIHVTHAHRYQVKRIATHLEERSLHERKRDTTGTHMYTSPCWCCRCVWLPCDVTPSCLMVIGLPSNCCTVVENPNNASFNVIVCSICKSFPWRLKRWWSCVRSVKITSPGTVSGDCSEARSNTS